MPTYGTPIDYDPFAVKPEPEEKPKAGVLRTIGDTAIGLGQGAISAVKTIPDLAAIAGIVSPKNGSSEGFRKASAVLDGFKSQVLLDREAAAQKRIADADGGLAKFTEAASSYLTDPRLALNMMAENAAMLVPSAAAGRFAGKTAQALGAAEKTVGKVGIGAAIGAGAVQQATDVSRGAYDTAIRDGATPEQAMSAARATFAPAAAISAGAQFLPGGASLERALVGGAARNVVKGGVMNRLYAGGRGALGEGVSELIEEGGGQRVSNEAQQLFANSKRGDWEGVGEVAGQALAGGVLLGGPAGLASGTQVPDAANANGAPPNPQDTPPLIPPEPGAPGAPSESPPESSPPIPQNSGPSVVVDPNAGVLSRGLAEMNGGDGVNPVAVPVPQAGPEEQELSRFAEEKIKKRAFAEAQLAEKISNQKKINDAITELEPLRSKFSAEQNQLFNNILAQRDEVAGKISEVQSLIAELDQEGQVVPDKQAQKEQKQAEREAFVDDAIDNQIATNGEVSKEASSALQITPTELREGVQRQLQDANIAKYTEDAKAKIEQTRQGFEKGIARERTKDVLENDSAFFAKVRDSLQSGSINRKAIAQDFGVSIADVSNAVKQVRKEDFEAEQAALAQKAANTAPMKVDAQAAQASGSQGDAITPPAAINPTVNEVSNEDESTNANGQTSNDAVSSNDGTQAEQATNATEKIGSVQSQNEALLDTNAPKEQTPGPTDAPVYSEDREVLEDDIAPSGAPFSSKQNAEAAAKRKGNGAKAIEVEGGYVVRFPNPPTANTATVPEATSPATSTAPAELPTAPAPIPDAPRAQNEPIAQNNAQPVPKPATKAEAEVRAARRYSPEELDGKIVYERLFDPEGNRLIHTGPLSTHKGQKPAAQFIKENDSLTKSYESLLKCLGG